MILIKVNILAPDIGLMFWTLLIFLILLFLLRKFAWKPIVTALKEREESIEKALNEARTAREEIENLKLENDKILTQAKIERDAMLRQAKELGDSIVSQAKENAHKEGKQILAETRELVKKEKEQAMLELKNEIGDLVIKTASKVIRQELTGSDQQKKIIEESLKELSN
jgi:F-type H+-transporting ATPase subunit b